jgi:hypothetical protein
VFGTGRNGTFFPREIMRGARKVPAICAEPGADLEPIFSPLEDGALFCEPSPSSAAVAPAAGRIHWLAAMEISSCRGELPR